MNRYEEHFNAALSHFDAGRLEPALAAFQAAHAEAPQELQAIYACAAVLAALDQPEASHRMLLDAKDLLWGDADGVFNLAVAAENLGHQAESQAAYERCLALAPDHLRALNNTALRLANQGQWTAAVDTAKRCLALAPQELLFHLNAVDILAGARRDAEALQAIVAAHQQFGVQPDIVVRHYALLAMTGQVAEAKQALQVLGDDAAQLLRQYASKARHGLPRTAASAHTERLDAVDLDLNRQFDALQHCDWDRAEGLGERLVAIMREEQSAQGASPSPRDWRTAIMHALTLDLPESDQIALRRHTCKTLQAWVDLEPWCRPRQTLVDSQSQWLSQQHAQRGIASGQAGDQRLRIGFWAQSLTDADYAAALLEQFQAHDHRKFQFFVQSPRLAGPELKQSLADLGVRVTELGHMSDEEAVGRIRLDRLDFWIDTTTYTRWCRVGLRHARVAPLQMLSQSWSRDQPGWGYDFNLGDTTTHGTGPISDVQSEFGAIVRMPHTCWLPSTGVGSDLPAPLARSQLGLPPDAPVLLANNSSTTLDAETFSAWMDILRGLPGAVLWLPRFGDHARNNLARAAVAAGVDTSRLVPHPQLEGAALHAALQAADLMLDTLRFNNGGPLVTALRLGIPAVNLRGPNQGSRLGAGILRAAGLADCVVDSRQAYVDLAVQLGRDAAARAALRGRLATQRQGPRLAPLFDLRARVREWEWAWERLIERDRAGLPPQALDVPPAPPT
jgi:protein O-GlcNAc transferase